MNTRRTLVALAAAFTAYLSVRGLWWIGPVDVPVLIAAAVAAYFITAMVCIFLPNTPGSNRLPGWATVAATAVAVIVPSAVQLGVGSTSRMALFATWYLGGIGALMTILMVRRRPLASWIGMTAMAAASWWWIGLDDSLAMGLVGSVMWVVVAQLLLWSLDRARREAASLAAMQQAASAWRAAQLIRRRERRVHARRALQVAGTVLAETVSTGGALGDDQRTRARVAEGRLRDEIRGARLLDDRVHDELERARRRGATVSVIDEGGLDEIDVAVLAQVRGAIADTLRDASSDRIYIRASAVDLGIAVTVVGRSVSGVGLPDEDMVDLWREIVHSTEDGSDGPDGPR